MLNATLLSLSPHFPQGFIARASWGPDRKAFEVQDLRPWWKRFGKKAPPASMALLKRHVLKMLRDKVLAENAAYGDGLVLVRGQDLSILKGVWSQHRGTWTLQTSVEGTPLREKPYDPHHVWPFVKDSMPLETALAYSSQEDLQGLNPLPQASMHAKMQAASFGQQPKDIDFLAALHPVMIEKSVIAVFRSTDVLGGVFYYPSQAKLPRWVLCGSFADV